MWAVWQALGDLSDLRLKLEMDQRHWSRPPHIDFSLLIQVGGPPRATLPRSGSLVWAVRPLSSLPLPTRPLLAIP